MGHMGAARRRGRLFHRDDRPDHPPPRPGLLDPSLSMSHGPRRRASARAPRPGHCRGPGRRVYGPGRSAPQTRQRVGVAVGSGPWSCNPLQPTNVRANQPRSRTCCLISSPSTRSRFALNFKPQLARVGLKNNPLPTLPSLWLRSATRSFDFSPDSDLPKTLRLDSRHLPTLHHVQLRMVEEARRYNVAACGRQRER